MIGSCSVALKPALTRSTWKCFGHSLVHQTQLAALLCRDAAGSEEGWDASSPMTRQKAKGQQAKGKGERQKARTQKAKAIIAPDPAVPLRICTSLAAVFNPTSS